MIDDVELHAWFCKEVLPLEQPLMRYIERNGAIVPVDGGISAATGMPNFNKFLGEIKEHFG